MASNVPLPELAPSDGSNADIRFFLSNENPRVQVERARWLHRWKTPDGKVFCSCGEADGEFVLRFHGALDFNISADKRNITCSPGKQVPMGTVRHLLIDQVVPRVLGHLGCLVVHGSAVMIDGKAVAFVGESGVGKSTLAAYLHGQGHTILSDDCFKLDDDDPTGISITPNYPGVRLFEDSSSELLARSFKSEVAHYTSKKRIFIERAEDTAHQPLAAIFFLASLNDNGMKNVELTPIHGLQRVMKLVQYCFGLYGGTDGELRKHFLKQGRLANSSIPFLRLSYPRRYGQLPTIRRKILETLRTAPGQ